MITSIFRQRRLIICKDPRAASKKTAVRPAASHPVDEDLSAGASACGCKVREPDSGPLCAENKGAKNGYSRVFDMRMSKTRVQRLEFGLFDLLMG
jgi:hypothetical protein